MGIKDKLNRLRTSRSRHIFGSSSNEKTGVMNIFLLMSAAIGTLLSLEREVHAAGTSCSDTINQRVTDTGNTEHDFGLEVYSWDDHSWHDHSWWDHDWWDHEWWDHTWTDYADGGGGTPPA